MVQRALITGGAGFFGHHLVSFLLRNTNWQLVIVDRLTHPAFGLARLNAAEAINNPRVQIFVSDLSTVNFADIAKDIGSINYLFHVGAETHVDRSIANPEPFVISNVLGTMRVLEMARKYFVAGNLLQFIYLSTDEVFGPALDRPFREWDRYNSRNPYAATKAGGEELSLAYANTYKLPVLIVHAMNLIGERQHPEKFIPKAINAIINSEVLSIHADETKTIAGSRFYLHCDNLSSAMLFLITHNDAPWKRKKVNVGGEREASNLELAQKIADLIGKKLIYEMVDFHSSRPGHDLRYALDNTVIKNLGWNYIEGFDQSLERTVDWYMKNQDWLSDSYKSIGNNQEFTNVIY